VGEDEKEEGEKEKNGRAHGNLSQGYRTAHARPLVSFFPLPILFWFIFDSLIMLHPLISRDARKAVCVPTTVIRSSVAHKNGVTSTPWIFFLLHSMLLYQSISHYFIQLYLSSQRENSSVAGKASVAEIVIFSDLMSYSS
jgi:hypothetical protein